MAVEILARALFAAGQARTVIAAELSPGGGPAVLAVSRDHSLGETMAAALGLDKVMVLATDEDIRAAEREQWDDGTNYLAVDPEW